jgi:hypothetical protein
VRKRRRSLSCVATFVATSLLLANGACGAVGSSDSDRADPAVGVMLEASAGLPALEMVLEVAPVTAVDRSVPPIAAAVRAALAKCKAQDPAMIAADAWLAGVTLQLQAKDGALVAGKRTGPPELSTCMANALSGAMTGLPAEVQSVSLLMRAAADQKK